MAQILFFKTSLVEFRVVFGILFGILCEASGKSKYEILGVKRRTFS